MVPSRGEACAHGARRGVGRAGHSGPSRRASRRVQPSLGWDGFTCRSDPGYAVRNKLRSADEQGMEPCAVPDREVLLDVLRFLRASVHTRVLDVLRFLRASVHTRVLGCVFWYACGSGGEKRGITTSFDHSRSARARALVCLQSLI